MRNNLSNWLNCTGTCTQPSFPPADVLKADTWPQGIYLPSWQLFWWECTLQMALTAWVVHPMQKTNARPTNQHSHQNKGQLGFKCGAARCKMLAQTWFHLYWKVQITKNQQNTHFPVMSDYYKKYIILSSVQMALGYRTGLVHCNAPLSVFINSQQSLHKNTGVLGTSWVIIKPSSLQSQVWNTKQ